MSNELQAFIQELQAIAFSCARIHAERALHEQEGLEPTARQDIHIAVLRAGQQLCAKYGGQFWQEIAERFEQRILELAQQRARELLLGKMRRRFGPLDAVSEQAINGISSLEHLCTLLSVASPPDPPDDDRAATSAWP